MVYRWHCRQCDYTVWSPDRTATADAIKSHLLDHYRNKLSKDDFRVSWQCPYCDRTSQGYDADESVDRFRNHLFEHVSSLLESGKHVADTIDRVLQPRGVAVVIEAEHFCMTTRGVRKPGASMITSAMRGTFKRNLATRTEAVNLLMPKSST